MYGCKRAMDGRCNMAMRWFWQSLLPGRLTVCLILSLGIHSILLLLQVVQTGSTAGDDAIAGQRESGRLQVFLAPRVGEIRVKRIPGDAESVAVNSGHPVRESSKPGAVVGFSGVLPERQPELVSEIDLEIDDPRVRGFIILHLQIDESGVVDAADVIYSEVSSDVTELLLRQFASARFKPAVKNGKAAEASILLRVAID